MSGWYELLEVVLPCLGLLAERSEDADNYFLPLWMVLAHNFLIIFAGEGMAGNSEKFIIVLEE